MGLGRVIIKRPPLVASELSLCQLQACEIEVESHIPRQPNEIMWKQSHLNWLYYAVVCQLCT